MDIATFLGILLGFAFMAIAIAISPGASFGAFVDYASVMIVVGGALASVMICFPLRAFLELMRVVKNVFVNRQQNLRLLIEELVSLGETARRDGLLALENRLSDISHPFIILGVQLAVDGTRPEVIEEVLRSEMEAIASRHRFGKNVVDQLGKFAPAYGMIGTLLGLIIMLGQLNDPESLGPGMAVALITTLYGAILANTILLPFAEKLAYLNKDELTAMELIVRGIMAIQSGENPRVIEQKLNTFLSPRMRGTSREAA